MLNFIGKWSLFSIYSIAVFLFIYFLNASYLFSIIKDWLLNNIEDGLTYDYIIVGAGSAGIILAARLTDAGNHVLLLEAGGPAPYFADIPILAPLLQKSPYDWQHKTVPQVNACKGLINNQSTWPMGKIMGGSSRLNYMAYVKGHPNDYYQWFPDYKNYELNNNLITENPQWCSELCNTILTSIAEISQNNNNTNNYLIDFWKVNLTMTNGQRWSTDKLLNTKYRKQLMIIQYAYVDKIKFKLNKAEGVEFTKWNKRFSANAREAVIISAGAIGTPKLLMLSGIGPKNHLNDLKINVISNLPVGQNLMDHILTGIDLITLNKTLTLNLANVLSPKSALDYYLYGKGPWTSAGIEVVGTLQKNTKNNTYKPPDLQFMVIPVGVSQDNGIIIRKAMGISDKIFNDYFSTLAFKTAITIAPVLLHPQSHGEVKLRSSNPLDDVIIDPKYLSNEKDVALLLKGIRFVEEMVNTEAMQALGASMYKKSFPGCAQFIFSSTKYWECYIRHLTLTSYHPAGTCKMGIVVNKNFQIYNTNNLYAVDASVLPVLPSGNINAAVMMLAEKASKILIQLKMKIRKSLISHKCNKVELFNYVFHRNLCWN